MGSAGSRRATSLPAVYRDPYLYDQLARLTAPDDLPWYRRQLRRWGGPLLDLGCGSGRVSLALAREGASVVGIDLSSEMIESARRKATAAGLEAVFEVGDMRDFNLGRRFKLIIVAYNTFNHLLTLDDLERSLGAVRRHLEPSGRLVIDTFNPNPAALRLDPSEPEKIVEYLDPVSRQRVELFEQNHYQVESQVNRITWSFTVDGLRGARTDELEMRVFFPLELDALLTLQGLAIEEKHGDYDGASFGPRSSNQLVTCSMTTFRQGSRRGGHHGPGHGHLSANPGGKVALDETFVPPSRKTSSTKGSPSLVRASW